MTGELPPLFGRRRGRLKGFSPGSRYTRNVSWKQRMIGAVVVTVLTGLPLSGAVCALLCGSAMHAASSETSTAAHHGSAEDCKKPPAPSGVQVGAVSNHPCGDHSSIVQPQTTVTPLRADANILVSPGVLADSQIEYIGVASFGSEAAYSPPPGIAPRTSTPVVLRV